MASDELRRIASGRLELGLWLGLGRCARWGGRCPGANMLGWSRVAEADGDRTRDGGAMVSVELLNYALGDC